MTEIMNDIYYMLLERIGQQCVNDLETKILRRRKSALIDEIILRLGENGDDLMDTLANLDADLETIHDKALFEAALNLGIQMAAN